MFKCNSSFVSTGRCLDVQAVDFCSSHSPWSLRSVHLWETLSHTTAVEKQWPTCVEVVWWEPQKTRSFRLSFCGSVWWL